MPIKPTPLLIALRPIIVAEIMMYRVGGVRSLKVCRIVLV